VKLYGSLTSPYVRKVRILLKEKGIPCEFVVVDPWAPDTVVPDMNPLGKVPILEMDDGQILFDSSVIVEYLDQLKGDPLIPPAGQRRWEVLRLQALSQGILDAVVTRLLETRRPAAQQSAETIKRQEEKVDHALAYAGRIERGPAYLFDDRFSFADLTLAVALEYIDFRYTVDWRKQHIRLAVWLAGIMTRPSFAETEPPGVERAVDSPH